MTPDTVQQRIPIPPIDLGAAYFGGDYKINDWLSVHQPTIGEIIEFGEKRYWKLINCVTIISSDMKSELAKSGLYWGDVSDFEVFYHVIHGIPVDDTRILFGGDVDFSRFGWYKQIDSGELCMVDVVSGRKIDNLLYSKLFNYIASIHGIKKKPEFAGNEKTRAFMVEDDELRKKRLSNEEYKSTLFPLSSYLSSVNKCSPEQIRDMKIFAFLDAIRRGAAINATNLLLNGIYAGKVDGEKVQKNQLDAMRDLYK